MSKGNFCNYDPNKVRIISKFIAPFNQERVAIEMSKIIARYEPDEPLKHLYDKVLDDLQLSENEELKLDFYSRTFVRDLIAFIENVSFPRNHQFWINLERLLFKWMIYRREQTVNTKNDENDFEESRKDLESIVCVITSETNIKIPISFNLKSMNSNTFNSFNSLITYEILENNHIFHSFANVIQGFHNIISIYRDEKTACRLLRIVYFNGHFDQNILLKYLILFRAPIKEMRECISNNDLESNHSSGYDQNKFNKKVTRKYLENLRMNGPKNLRYSSDEEKYLSKFILNSIKANGQGIEMPHKHAILPLLRALKREGLLSWEMVMGLCRFYILDGSGRLGGWNQKDFDDWIKELRNNFNPKDLSELEEYLNELGPQFTNDFKNPISPSDIQSKEKIKNQNF